MNRRGFSVLAAGAATLWALPAAASEEWCAADPAVPVKTSSGETVVVHLNVYGLGTEHRAALARTSHRCEVSHSALGTEVVLTVEIPLGAEGQSFRTRASVSTAPHERGDVLSRAEGRSGEPLVLTFTLAGK
jgi:hypothetical protein